MSLFDIFKKRDPEVEAREAELTRRRLDLERFIQGGAVPPSIQARLQNVRAGALPWVATLTPAELMIARSHGLRPIAAVSATCWLHYGWSWTKGHAEGWGKALDRLREEARACGANAVLDVKMRTIPLAVDKSMDFTLVGTAVHVEGLPPSSDPVIATVPALEFVKLLEADIVPAGIAVGAHYEWLTDSQGQMENLTWMGNVESGLMSGLWERVRQRAHHQLRSHARSQGNGVLAHINFSQMFERKSGDVREYLARHIVVATTVDSRPATPWPHGISMVVDMRDRTPLTGTERHHQSYDNNESEGAI